MMPAYARPQKFPQLGGLGGGGLGGGLGEGSAILLRDLVAQSVVHLGCSCRRGRERTDVKRARGAALRNSDGLTSSVFRAASCTYENEDARCALTGLYRTQKEWRTALLGSSPLRCDMVKKKETGTSTRSRYSGVLIGYRYDYVELVHA